MAMIPYMIDIDSVCSLFHQVIQYFFPKSSDLLEEISGVAIAPVSSFIFLIYDDSGIKRILD